MDRMPFPTQTASARQWLRRPDATIDRIHRALLSTIDGRRTVVELESVARAMRLAPGALEHLREQGFIELARSTAPQIVAGS